MEGVMMGKTALIPCHNVQRFTCDNVTHKAKANVSYCSILRNTNYPDYHCAFYKPKGGKNKT